MSVLVCTMDAFLARIRQFVSTINIKQEHFDVASLWRSLFVKRDLRACVLVYLHSNQFSLILLISIYIYWEIGMKSVAYETKCIMKSILYNFKLLVT